MSSDKLPPLGAKELEILTLPPGFDPGGFHCREPELCSYLLEGDAARDHETGVATTYIARLRIDRVLVGYFTVLADSIKLDPTERPRRVPYAMAPALKLGRLGVDHRFSGRDVGVYILSYIVGMGRSLRAQVGLRYITLDALPRPNLIKYYSEFGFVRNITPAIGEDGGDAEEVSMRFDLWD